VDRDDADSGLYVEAASDGPVSSQSDTDQPHLLRPHATHTPQPRWPPAHPEDYICYTLRATNPLSLAHRLQDDSSGTSYPIANYVTCTNFSIFHQNFLAAITKVKEPKYYHEAARDSRW